MIQNLRTSLLLPAELAEIANNYLGVVQDSSLSDPFVQRLVALLEADVKRVNEALTAVRLNQLVSQVAVADSIRDDLYISLKDLVDSHKRRRNEAHVAAYNTTWPIIEKAGVRLYELGYDAQSGRLKAFFQEMDKAGPQEALAAMNALELYQDLKLAQEEFDDLYDRRLEEDLKKQYPTLSEAKAEIVKHLNAMLRVVDVLDETDEPGMHEAAISKMNEITAGFMATARTRKTRRERGEEDDTAVGGEVAAE